MAVYSLETGLNIFLEEHLKKIIPADVICIFHMTVVHEAGVCEHGDLFNDPFWKVHLHFEWPKEDRPSVSLSTLIPYLLVANSDTDPIEQVANTLWQSAQFYQIVHDTDLNLDEVGVDEAEE